MTRPMDERQVPEALLAEQDEHVDTAVALGRGELPKAQAEEVRARMRRDAGYRAVVEPIARAYDEPALSVDEARVKWPELARAAGMPESAAHAAVGTPKERDPLARRRMVSMLAGSFAAVLLVVAGLGSWNYLEKARLYDTFRTGPGETFRIMLPDRTKATIGPSSELKYRTDMWMYGSDQRVVWPKGVVTLEVNSLEPPMPRRGQPLTTFRIEGKYATVIVELRAQVKVEELRTSTSVAVVDGMVRARPRAPGRPEPAGDGLAVKAPWGVRFSELGYHMYQVTREP